MNRVTSRRRIGPAVGCGKRAVSLCLQRAAAAGLMTWETVATLGEEALERRPYPAAAAKPAATGGKARPLPDWTRIREELARRDHKVTLMLLLTECKAEHPDGYQYSQFAKRYRRFEKQLSVVLRQQHRPGKNVFVDIGLATLNELERQDLPEAIEERYGNGATLVTSQLPVANWHAYLGGGRLADAILDRLVHNAHRIDL